MKKFINILLIAGLVGAVACGSDNNETEIESTDKEYEIRDNQPWPFNGRVVNKSRYSIRCWSDTNGFFNVAPFAVTPISEDVDFCVAPTTGKWYKISWHNFTVNVDGLVSGYACAVSAPNTPCL